MWTAWEGGGGTDRVALTYAPYQASPVAQWPRPAAKQECVRLLSRVRLFAKQEMWLQSLGGEDPLGEEVAPHSTILDGKITRIEKPGGLQ